MAESPTAHILQSLVVNAVIATVKIIAAVFTHSGSMMAEAIHSAADCGNQLLLLMGVKQAQRPPDAKHPLGYGRSVYFWSFMVALLLFTGGGVFSIYEGFHKLSHPEPMEHVQWAVGILAFSTLLESWATWGNVKALNERRGSTPFFRYLSETKDSDLVVVFGENSAAVLGLLVALTAILIYQVTGDPRADGAGSLAVGVVLVAVAIFLAREVHSLLLGEAASPEVEANARRLATQDPRVHSVINCITVQQGPGQVLVAIKLRCDSHISAADLSALINTFEAALRAASPEARWIYVEPDLQEWKAGEPV